MNKKIASIVLSAAALSMTAVHAYAEEESSLLVVGDSIATGYGLDGYVSGDNTSAPDSFANRLSADFTEYTNLAVDGRTSALLLESFSEEETLSAVENADTVVMSIGGNDFLIPMVTAVQMSVMSDPEIIEGIKDGSLSQEDIMNKAAEVDIEETVINAANNVDISLTEENVNEILEKIYSINPDVNVYILTVYNPFEDIEGMENISDTAEVILPRLNEAIENAAAEYDSTYVIDVNSEFKGNAAEYTNILEMDIHPNKAGHNVIYDLLVSAVKANTSSVSETYADAAEYVPDEGNTSSAPTGNADITAIAGVAAAALTAAFLTAVKRK